MKKGNTHLDFQRRASSLWRKGIRDGISIFLLFVSEDTMATAARIPATTRTNILVPDVGRLEVC